MHSETPAIVFDDGDTYERYMGIWSRKVGKHFINWLGPKNGNSFADIGCGNAVFSVQLDELCSPKRIAGIDPSEAQINYAKKLKFNTSTDFIVGDAMSLPYDDNSFDVALMALVLFFVPKPATGVREMTRITKAGGVIAAYAWDVLGGGLPMEPLHSILRERGIEYPLPPSKEVSQLHVMQQLWEDAGLEAIETTTFQVQRTFANFDDYWSVNSVGPSVAGVLKNLTPSTLEEIKRDLGKVLKRDDTNRIVSVASANAVKGAKG